MSETNNNETLLQETRTWLYNHLGRRAEFTVNELREADTIRFDRASEIINLFDKESLFYSRSFQRFHEGIYHLPALQKLRCLENNVYLDEKVGQLKNLETLFVRGRGTIPSSLFGLTNLKELALLDFEQSEQPLLLSNLSRLETLLLINIGLKEIPEGLSSCARLTQLNLRNNQLTSLPEELAGLTRLEGLHLGNNQLTELPAWLGECKNLTHLVVQGNDIPEEEIRGFKARFKHINVS